jgi:hypothetical protein
MSGNARFFRQIDTAQFRTGWQLSNFKTGALNHSATLPH